MSEQNELQVAESTHPPADMKSAAVEYLRSKGLSLPTKYEAQFLNACVLYGLNPFKREIYAVGYGDKWNIIVGYEVYLKRAERTGKLDGWQCEVTGSGGDMKAVLTVWRKDWAHPFTYETWFSEIAQKSPVWQKMPRYMLKKCAIAQGFRQCFPDEMGALPYTDDELGVINVTPKDVPPEVPQTTQAIAREAAEDVTPQVASETKEEHEGGAPDTASPTDEELQMDALKHLNELSLRYKAELAGRPQELIAECKATKGDAVAMLERTKSYLTRKGVEV